LLTDAEAGVILTILRKSHHSVKSSPRPDAGSYRNLLLICLTALLFSTGASWFFHSRWEEASDKYASVLAQQYEASHQLLQIQDELNRIHPDLDVMRDTEYEVFTLRPVGGTSEGVSCRIYWNSVTGEALLDPNMLPEAESGMTYRVDYVSEGRMLTVKTFEKPLNHDQLLPLGSISGVTGWSVYYGPLQPQSDNTFREVASTR
jgi:hypothetical protein